MAKRQFKPGNMLYPLPAVMVSVADKEGNSNIITVAWAGTVCTNPPMLSISVRPERYSYHMLRETGEFVVNLTTEELAHATDYCGVRSGRDTDKWKDCGLTREKASKVSVPLIKECPVNLECRVVRVDELGSHHMFLAEIVAVDVDDAYMDAIEPFDYSAITDFHTDYLPGYAAQTYDEDATACAPRATARVKNTTIAAIRRTCDYTTLTPRTSKISTTQNSVDYALLPVWMLTTNWHGKSYHFAINGQTGKLIGDLPIDKGRFFSLLAGITIPLGILLKLFIF